MSDSDDHKYTVERITAAYLADKIRTDQARSGVQQEAPSGPTPTTDGRIPGTSKYAIIDVRDSDFPGGNIVGARNIPKDELRYHVRNVCAEFKDYDWIVFHCMLSQMRGPSSARLFRATMSELYPESKIKVYILDQGFQGFVADMRKEKELFENMDEYLWGKIG